VDAVKRSTILFPAIYLKVGPARRPLRSAREDARSEKSIGHV
jgi:hypothetical protein